MLDYIWFGLLVLGFIVGIFSGRAETVTKAAIDSASGAVSVGIGLLGVMCLWTGMMAIAEKSGLVQRIAGLARPVLKLLFPGLARRHPALGAIVMNLVANFLGLGNAATPLGIKAMNELQKLNPKKDTATDDMSMFLVLNTAAVQLVPATVIALRSAAGSLNPAEITVTVWIASISATLAGVTAAKALSALCKSGFRPKRR
ncbi:MAG: nucleoside recognition domain-containing protein [Clostridiales bacterium]|jgi:spore maturation protein A|nr:nucleoside recognition protein [Eubacteriales bacterium]MDH7566102.1 nucleoside recognition domain-containing protein [Clostridiales bacterium]